MSTIPTTIAPWLHVKGSVQAVAFYKSAFKATEAYRMDVPDGTVVAKLSVNGAEFWVGEESAPDSLGPQSLGGVSARIILTVDDPDTLFAQVLAAGATQVFAITEEYGWRIGRLVDPFGHHWEIGKPLDAVNE